MNSLRLDWCSYEAAKYAVEHWHYSHNMPKSKNARIGVWEDGRFVGCVIFGMGASSHLGNPYGLDVFQAAELVRVALTKHNNPVSKIVSIATRMLRREMPGLRLLVSYADPMQNHHGGIYQALNWIYVGDTSPDYYILDKNGRKWHSRVVSPKGYKSQYGVMRKAIRPDEGEKVITLGKHKYLMPLDDDMRRQIEPLRKPYPKRAGEAKEIARPATSGETEGASPIRPLEQAN
jgi:hypothetical protein